jgi:hypothetical protein
MGEFLSKTFSAASSDLATYLHIPIQRDAPLQSIVHVISVTVHLEANVNDAEVELALANGTTVFQRIRGTIAGTARRAGLAGASGDFIGIVTFELTGSNMFDLAGAGYAGAQWYIGLPVLGAAVSVDVFVAREANENHRK